MKITDEDSYHFDLGQIIYISDMRRNITSMGKVDRYFCEIMFRNGEKGNFSLGANPIANEFYGFGGRMTEAEKVKRQELEDKYDTALKDVSGRAKALYADLVDRWKKI